jgi:hypothetical protein
VENTCYNIGLLQSTVTIVKLGESIMDSEMKGSEVGNFHRKMEADDNVLGFETKIS